jgi:hypothetical protein
MADISVVKEFYLFPQLPIELRLEIFKLALPTGHQGRHLIPLLGYSPHNDDEAIRPRPRWLRTHFAHKFKVSHNTERCHLMYHDLKSIAHSATCQASREVFLNTFNQSIPFAENGGTIHFSPSNTIIFFDQIPFVAYLFTMAKQGVPLPAWVHSIENLAINETAFFELMCEGSRAGDDWIPKEFGAALKNFRDLKTMTWASIEDYGDYRKKASDTFKECCLRLQQEKDSLSLEYFIPEMALIIRLTGVFLGAFHEDHMNRHYITGI